MPQMEAPILGNGGNNGPSKNSGTLTCSGYAGMTTHHGNSELATWAVEPKRWHASRSEDARPKAVFSTAPRSGGKRKEVRRVVHRPDQARHHECRVVHRPDQARQEPRAPLGPYLDLDSGRTSRCCNRI